jgi:hypothetical protein
MKANSSAHQLLDVESHAAAMRKAAITHEKTIGMVKAYLQLRAAIPTKQMASDH